MSLTRNYCNQIHFDFKNEMMEELEEGLDAMCNLSQGIEDEAKKKAKKKQAIRDIKNVMESLDLSAAKLWRS